MPEEQVDGRRRVVIERVRPQIDCGRFAIKRVVAETVVLEADVFADGPDQIAYQVLYWRNSGEEVQSSPMKLLGNDRWRGDFTVLTLG
jgi:starch synthase (maltosyl-transferring)